MLFINRPLHTPHISLNTRTQMNLRLLDRARWSVLVVVSAFLTMPGWAQTAQQKQAVQPVSSGYRLTPAAIPQKNWKPTSQAGKVMTPYERVFTPHLASLLKHHQANQTTSAAAKYSAEGNGVGGTSTNFPGFAAVPILKFPDIGSGPTYTSVTADFNNDGKMDFASIEATGAVHVILNPGSMSNLANITPLPANTSEHGYASVAWVTAVDLNGDGYPDLVGQEVANNQILVWIGNGDGTFKPVQSYALPVSTGAASGASWWGGGSLLIGDFNGDGAPDVVTVTQGLPYGDFSNYGSTLIRVQTFLNANDGSGTLLAPTGETDVTFQDVYTANYGEAAVVTNDGVKASGIAVLVGDEGVKNPANEGVDIVIFPSDGKGGFTAPSEPASPLVQDGYLSADGSFFATALRTSATGLSKGRVTPLLQGQPSSGVATADIVFMTGDGAVYDAPYAAGSPLAAANILVGANKWLGNPGIPIPNQEVLNVSDLDGDGYPDLLVHTIGNAIIYSNGGSGAFAGDPIQLAGGVSGDEDADPADFDGSGHNSFLWADAEFGDVAYYQNLGPASTSVLGQIYAAPAVAGSNNSTGVSQLSFSGNIQVQAAADINGDGLLDVIALDQTNAATNGYVPDVVLGINNGTGNTNAFTFTIGIPAATLATMGGGLSFIEPLTIPNSAGVSLLLAAQNGLYISTIDNTGKFSTPRQLNLGVTVSCPLGYADTGDINGDGITDIVVAYSGDASCLGSGSTPSGYFTLLGAGGDTFAPASFTAFGNALYMPRLINLNDTTNALDLVLNDPDFTTQQFNLYILPGNGDGTFNTSSWREPISSYIITDIIPGDYNSDGYQDLTLTTEGQFISGEDYTAPHTEGVLLVPGKGNYQFGTAQLVSPSVNYEFAAWGSYADFNGDGAPDLALLQVVPNPQSGATPIVKILPNLGGGNFGPSVSEFDAFTSQQSGYTFTGNFGNSGGTDLLVAGEYNSAVYLNQAGTSLQLTSSSTSPQQGASVTFTATLSSPVGNPIPYSGTVTFTSAQTGTVLATASIANNAATFTTSNLPVGLTVVAATYSGDANHNGAGTAVGIMVSALAADTLTLTASPASAAQGQTVTLTATLAGSANSPAPTGTVTFSSNGSSLGSAPVGSDGTTTISTSQLPVGSDPITASYAGDSNNSPATGATTVTVTTLNPGFTVSAPASLSLAQGATGSVTLSFLANATFSGAITVSCAGAPAEASCSVNPGSITLAPGQSGTATVVIATTPPNNTYEAKHTRQTPLWAPGAGGIVVAGVGILIWPRRRRMRGLFMAALIAALSLGSLGMLSGCGGSSKPPVTPADKYSGTPLGTSTITVTATSGAITQSQTITLTVTGN
jgi:hypothetical protein